MLATSSCIACNSPWGTLKALMQCLAVFRSFMSLFTFQPWASHWIRWSDSPRSGTPPVAATNNVSPVMIHGNVEHSSSEININLLSVGRQYINGRFTPVYLGGGQGKFGVEKNYMWVFNMVCKNIRDVSCCRCCKKR